MREINGAESSILTALEIGSFSALPAVSLKAPQGINIESNSIYIIS